MGQPAEQQSRVGQIIQRLVLCFFALMTLTIVYQSLTSQFGGWEGHQYVYMAVFVSVVISGCCLMARTKASPSRLLWLILSLSLILRLSLVAILPTEPTSDFGTIFYAAQSAAAGNLYGTHIPGNYFYVWGYQAPFMLYEAVVLYLFRSPLALKLLNVLFMVGANYLLYRLGKLYLSERAALCIALIYALFPDMLFYTTVLTNQHIALFFLLLGVFLLLNATRWWELALAGLSLAVSDLMRPEAVIILAACLCCGVLRCIQSPRIATLKRVALSLALVLACYWLTKTLTEALLVWTDIAPYGFENRAPEWKFVVGLGNVEGYGTYSAEHGDVPGMDREGRRAVLAALVSDLFHRPPAQILDFFVGKLRLFWTSPQHTYWAFAGVDPDRLILPEWGVTLYDLVNPRWCGAGMSLLVYLLALPAPLFLWKDREGRRGKELFFIAVLCVTICVYLLIEIQARYRLVAVPFWLLVGGITLERLIQWGPDFWASLPSRFAKK